MLQTIIALAVVLFDQLTKWWAKDYLATVNTLPIINDVFHFTYTENTGAAFSIFSNSTLALAIISASLSAAMIVFLIKTRKDNSKMLKISLSMVLGGAIGNLIDRAVLGYVVDFLDFRLINFAVFNVADSAVCIGAVVLAIYILFFADKKKNDIKSR